MSMGYVARWMSWKIIFFFHCDLSHLFWLCSPPQLNSHDLVGEDFLASWEKFCNRVKGIDNVDKIM